MMLTGGRRRVWLVILALLLVIGAVVPLMVHAAAGRNPWEAPLTDIAMSVIGPVALAGFLIALGVFCITAWMGYTALGAAVALVALGAVLANAESIAGWIGLKG